MLRQKLMGYLSMNPVKDWRSMPSTVCQCDWHSAVWAVRWTQADTLAMQQH